MKRNIEEDVPSPDSLQDLLNLLRPLDSASNYLGNVTLHRRMKMAGLPSTNLTRIHEYESALDSCIRGPIRGWQTTLFSGHAFQIPHDCQDFVEHLLNVTLPR
jgi:hypothetical protein